VDSFPIPIEAACLPEQPQTERVPLLARAAWSEATHVAPESEIVDIRPKRANDRPRAVHTPERLAFVSGVVEHPRRDGDGTQVEAVEAVVGAGNESANAVEGTPDIRALPHAHQPGGA
jgi:hypothetical protein